MEIGAFRILSRDGSHVRSTSIQIGFSLHRAKKSEIYILLFFSIFLIKFYKLTVYKNFLFVRLGFKNWD